VFSIGLGRGLGSDSVFGWLVVMHTYLHYFPLTLYLTRVQRARVAARNDIKRVYDRWWVLDVIAKALFALPSIMHPAAEAGQAGRRQWAGARLGDRRTDGRWSGPARRIAHATQVIRRRRAVLRRRETTGGFFQVQRLVPFGGRTPSPPAPPFRPLDQIKPRSRQCDNYNLK